MVTATARAQGWYRDPFGRHEDRYFSVGTPTKLVRDHAVESYDPPPADQPMPLALAPVAWAADPRRRDHDLRRADDLQRGETVDVWRRVLDALTRCVGTD